MRGGGNVREKKACRQVGKKFCKFFEQLVTFRLITKPKRYYASIYIQRATEV